MPRRRPGNARSWPGTILAFAIAVASVGFLIPSSHVRSRTAVYPVEAKELWTAVSSFADQSGWRDGVDRVFALPDRDGHPTWRETGRDGTREFEVVTETPPRHMVLSFSGDELHGTWTFQIGEEEGGARLTLTEAGSVPGVAARVLAYAVDGRGDVLDAFLEDLGGRFGASVEIGVIGGSSDAGAAPDLGRFFGLD